MAALLLASASRRHAYSGLPQRCNARLAAERYIAAEYLISRYLLARVIDYAARASTRFVSSLLLCHKLRWRHEAMSAWFT